MLTNKYIYWYTIWYTLLDDRPHC